MMSFPFVLSRFALSRPNKRAQSLVEFALVLPIFLVILLGIVEFGVYAKNGQTIANAAREGARAAAVGRSTADTRARVTTQAAPLSVASPTGSITLEMSTNNGASYTALPADANGKNGATTGSLVRVTVVARNRSVTGFFGSLFNRDLRTAVVMRREG